MIFDHVKVMGLVSDTVVRVLVNGVKHDHFNYDTNTEVMQSLSRQLDRKRKGVVFTTTLMARSGTRTMVTLVRVRIIEKCADYPTVSVCLWTKG